jgi:mono/diheme cytochrome c family protein
MRCFFRARACTSALLLLLVAGLGAMARAADTDLVKRGEYLALAGDCVACHSAPGGQPMAGGLSLPTPLGTIVSTNITPSRTHGIGNYSFEQFSAALRRGIRADGARLYPAMPYPSYAKVTDDDAHALYAYFTQGVAPVDSAAQPTRLPFPFNVRASMRIWNALYLDEEPYHPVTARGAEWNRGAYLVQGLTHCSTCHTPRGLLMAEDRSRDLAGGSVGPWEAPNITSDGASGIGGWSVEELAGYLQTGHARDKSQAAGPMAEAVDFSLRHLAPGDLRAIAVYLKTVPAVHDASDDRPVHAWGAPAADLAAIRGVAWPRDREQLTGPQLYDAHCATCHQARGEGSFDGGLPALFHNTALGRANSANLVMVVLEGLHRQPDVYMPAFGRELSDMQIATLASYVTRRWGNPKATVSAEQVRTLREGGPRSTGLLTLARGGIGVAVVLLALFVLLVARRQRRPS